MASYISPYRGQSSFLPQGYLEAATESGRNIARGIEKAGSAIGEGLGKAIANYKKNKEDDQAVTQMLETTLPGVMEESYIHVRAENEDQEAAAFMKQAKRFEDGEMKLSEKKSFAANLMLFREREQKKARENEEAQRFWMQYSANQNNADREFKAAEDQRAWMRENTMWQLARQNGMDLREEERRKNEEAVAAAVLGYKPAGPVTESKEVTEENPAFTDYMAQQEQIQAAYQDALQTSRAAAAPSGPAVRPGSADPAFYKETLARALDSIRGRNGRIPSLPDEYRTYPGQVPQVLMDQVPTGQPDPYGRPGTEDVVNMKRVGTMIKMLNSDGVNTPAIRQLEYLTNPRQQAAQAPVNEPDLTYLADNASLEMSNLGEAPPAQVTRTVQQSRPRTQEEREQEIRQYVQDTMPNASNTAKLAAMNHLLNQEAPRFQTMQGPNGAEYVKLPPGFQAAQQPVSVTDQIALMNEQRKVNALSVPGYKGQAPSEQEAKEFREVVASTEKSLGIINRLSQIADLPGKSITPTIRAEAENLTKMLQAAMRLELIGPGAVSEGEWKLLNDIVANPARFWTLDKSNKTRLQSIEAQVRESLANRAQVLGLKPAGSEENQEEQVETKKTRSGRSYQVIR